MAKASFKQRDVTRLIKGAMAAGLPIGSFSIQLVDGRPSLVPVGQGGCGKTSSLRATPGDEDLDAELEAWRGQHGEG